MKRDSYETRTAEMFARVNNSPAPERAAVQMLGHLEHKAVDAESWQASEEAFLTRAVELMRRADHARQAAVRASAERARIEDERQRVEGTPAQERSGARAISTTAPDRTASRQQTNRDARARHRSRSDGLSSREAGGSAPRLHDPEADRRDPPRRVASAVLESFASPEPAVGVAPATAGERINTRGSTLTMKRGEACTSRRLRPDALSRGGSGSSSKPGMPLDEAEAPATPRVTCLLLGGITRTYRVIRADSR